MTRPKHVDQAIFQDKQGFYTGNDGSFTLHPAYQPIVHIAGDKRQNYAYEGLIRPMLGGVFVPPLEFLNQVKQEGRFFAEWMCRALHLRNAFSLHQANLRLFINLDPSLYSSFEQSRHEIDIMLRKMEDLGLSANNIVIEIIENQASDDTVLHDIAQYFLAHNVSIAIDDFGTLYSDMARVDLLQPKYVKYRW
jgi:EAL domain-containing protein (putative c-di-GMP-specific phosphodiesterase class I)